MLPYVCKLCYTRYISYVTLRMYACCVTLHYVCMCMLCYVTLRMNGCVTLCMYVVLRYVCMLCYAAYLVLVKDKYQRHAEA